MNETRLQGLPRHRGLVGLAVAILIAGAAFLGWKDRSDATSSGAKPSARSAPAAVPVTLASVESSAFPVYLDGLGTVQAYNTAVMRPRVDGQIDTIAFREGQMVEKGDLLVRIDPRPYQASLDQAKAKKIQDEAALKNEKADLQRYTSLGEFATRQQVDTQGTTVNQGTAQIAADQAAIDNAQTQLGYTSILAPFTGLTGLRQVDVGNIVNAATQTGIVTITQIQPISVVFTAPEERVPDINAALAANTVPISAFSTDGSRKLSDGKLEVVNNQVDTASGTVRLKATFENKDRALWPGLSVSTRLLIGTLENVVTVPDDAVQHGPDGLFAYVVDPAGRASRTPITVRMSGDGRSVVASGLSAGQRVVTAGQYRVQDGTLVAEAKPSLRKAETESR